MTGNKSKYRKCTASSCRLVYRTWESQLNHQIRSNNCIVIYIIIKNLKGACVVLNVILLVSLFEFNIKLFLSSTAISVISILRLRK